MAVELENLQRTAPPGSLVPQKLLFLYVLHELGGFQVILRVALDGAGFFMSIGVEIMPKYGLEVDCMIFGGIEQ